MIKTHEKSEIVLINGKELSNDENVILQIDTTAQYQNGNYGVYIAEIVDRNEYDRTTAEGRAEAAEKRLEDEMNAHKIEIGEMEAKAEALEEMLEQQRDWTREKEVEVIRIGEENQKLYEALVECKRIFGLLPTEIEKLLKGDLSNVYTGTV